MWTSKYFVLRRIFFTQNIAIKISESIKFTQEVFNAMDRYCNMDWGELPQNDISNNDKAIICNKKNVFASYNTSQGKINVITNKERNYTLILFADEKKEEIA